MTAPGNAPASIASAMIAAAPSKPSRVRLGSSITSDHRGLERGESSAVDVELHLDAKGQGEVLDVDGRGRVSGRQAEPDREWRLGEDVSDHVDGGNTVQGAAGFHGAEDHAGGAIELPGLAPLGEQAIEAIGPFVDV